MLGLTTLGLFHTAIGLVALVYGAITLVRHRQITLETQPGRIYLGTTLVTALTSLGIFQHGGFGVPHVLALLTLLALAVGFAAGRSTLFGRFAPYLQVVAYSATVLFHLIPGVAETSTRLPPSAPLVASAESPELVPVFGVLLLLYLVGVTWQLRWLRATLPR